MSDDNNPQIDLNSPEIQAAIAAQVDAQVSGLKTKNSELLGKLNTANSDFSAFKSQFEGVDLEQYKAYSEKLKQDETARLIAEGKIDEVLNQRVQAMQQDYEGKLKASSGEAELYKSKVLNGYVSTAAAQAGVDPSALNLVSLLAQQSGIKLDQQGNPIVTNTNGDIVYSKDGTTPLSLNEWLLGLRETTPLLWGQPQGGGSGGGQGGQAKQPQDYTEREKQELFHKNREEYNRLFKKD